CLKILGPDIFVKAGDYTIDKMHQGERRIIEACGGEIKFIHLRYHISTSKIIEKIKNKG
ncbi:unnamed protein product, partial [marine sediment metagenome]